MSLPKVAYILRWFPKPSETFIFNEVSSLYDLNLPVKVHTLYGVRKKNLAPRMLDSPIPIRNMGIPYLPVFFADLVYWLRKNPKETGRIFGRNLKNILFKRYAGIESAGENLWAMLCGFGLARRFMDEGVKHIHAPWANGPAMAGLVASRLTGLPYSIAAHAGDVYPPDGALEDKIAGASFVRVENKATLSHMESFGARKEDLFAIYNGVPTKTWSARKVDLKPPVTLLGLGRFVPKKGFPILLQALRILLEKGLDIRLLLGGSGGQERDLAAMAKKPPLAGRVEFAGFVRHDKLGDFFAKGDLFVMPSIIVQSGDRDGLPTVMLESLLNGVPVLASDVQGISEVIEDQVSGFLVRPGDPEALAATIEKIIADPDKARQTALKGRERVLEDFDEEKNAAAMLQLFKKYTPKS